ncbi:hypothetical protein [Luteibaculum oceani]|uniref:Uncharacterized protein n=1 Tax=Luteibaculum oceani TaxID=1294296 RepID=A0A5C6UZX1_9FLAO|nr:hypothetical protein [Luteibaculum oceani]TXC76205.1 hypothetical protein FRX97_10665 [Luteibaculum oceani]
MKQKVLNTLISNLLLVLVVSLYVIPTQGFTAGLSCDLEIENLIDFEDLSEEEENKSEEEKESDDKFGDKLKYVNDQNRSKNIAYLQRLLRVSGDGNLLKFSIENQTPPPEL